MSCTNLYHHIALSTWLSMRANMLHRAITMHYDSSPLNLTVFDSLTMHYKSINQDAVPQIRGYFPAVK